MTIAGQLEDVRSEPREPVLYRTRLTGADGIERPAMLVNISPSGFMARCEAAHSVGDAVRVVFPRLGRADAIVRWQLGGRIGCQLQRPCSLSDYHLLLHALPKG